MAYPQPTGTAIVSAVADKRDQGAVRFPAAHRCKKPLGKVPGEVVGHRPVCDLSPASVGKKDLRSVTLGNYEAIRVYDPLAAIGIPLSLNGTITTGDVSAYRLVDGICDLLAVLDAYACPVFNVGLLEIAVIAVLGLLIFGPDKLPKAAQSLMNGIRLLRGAADDASKSLQGAAGIDGETAKQTMSDLASLHPKNWAAGLLTDEASGQASTSKAAPATPQTVGDPGSVSSAERSESPAPDLDPDLP